MKIDKVSGYFLKNDNGREIRIMYMDYRWHFIINDDSVFSFSEDDAKEFADLFNEINRSISVTDRKVWKDIDKAINDSKLDRQMHLPPMDGGQHGGH